MNAAQQLHEFLGVPVADGRKLAHGNENASATKAGPGRYHAYGLKEERKPKQRGAGADFKLHTNKAKQHRREQIKQLGRRQFLKLQKQLRAIENAPQSEREMAGV